MYYNNGCVSSQDSLDFDQEKKNVKGANCCVGFRPKAKNKGSKWSDDIKYAVHWSVCKKVRKLTTPHVDLSSKPCTLDTHTTWYLSADCHHQTDHLERSNVWELCVCVVCKTREKEKCTSVWWCLKGSPIGGLSLIICFPLSLGGNHAWRPGNHE